jgi:predicted amino acid dehydrogenase
MTPKFAFLIHPLAGFQRRLIGVRRLHVPLIGGGPGGVDVVGPAAKIWLDTAAGRVHGVIVAVPDLADQLVVDQARALALQERAAHAAIAAGADVIGLGNALAVVAGRGKELAARVPVPVTTGQASTAWACAAITRLVLAERGLPRGPVGVLGFAGTVGDAVAASLRDTRVDVRVEAPGAALAKRAAALGAVAGSLDDVLGCPVLVGAATTGPLLAPERLRPGTILVDLALPPTLSAGPLPAGVRIVRGEALSVPGRMGGRFWGRLWLLLAAYGRGCVYACLAEPAAMALTGARGWSEGRRLDPDRVAAAGEALRALGFTPVVRATARR